MKIGVTHDQLESLIVNDVRRRAHCDGFKAISFYRTAEIAGTNWVPASVNYGKAGSVVCDAALREIIPRMQREYDLIGG